jgi:hypothetical protein
MVEFDLTTHSSSLLDGKGRRIYKWRHKYEWRHVNEVKWRYLNIRRHIAPDI